MNTVDALNVLGKALCGDSFEVKPGLTDAETILEIAKNYSGGSGSGGGRIIDLTTLEPRQEVHPEDDENIINYFSGYEAGLSAEDFINSWVTGMGGRGALETFMSIMIDDGFVKLAGMGRSYYYNPETGEFFFITSGGNPK